MALREEELHPHFKKWFPRPLPEEISSEPLMRIFCFHGAGMDFTVWTTMGSPKAPMPNSLSSFCAKENIQLLAAQLPGRAVRIKETLPPSVQACATELLEVIESVICTSVPYVLIGYSMGCWIAYELCCAINKRRQEKCNIRQPERVILASMVSPTLPPTKRPWSITASLSTERFQAELRDWSCNEVLFQPALWKAYEPMLRNDHKLLDDYVCTMPDTPLNVPCTVFRARGDIKLQDDTLFAGWFSLFAEDHHASKWALSTPDTCTPGTSTENRNISNVTSPTDGSASPASDSVQGMANLTIGFKRRSSAAETSRMRSEHVKEEIQYRSPEGDKETEIKEQNPCVPTNSDSKTSMQTDTTILRAEIKDKSSCHSHIQLLEGNHGLMYDPRWREYFFKELEKILEHQTLEITYGRA